MAVAAELEALALERPGLIRLDPDEGGVPGYRVLLAAEVRYPERMDDVLGGELELDLLADWDVELLAGLKQSSVRKLEHRRIRIREAPGPLAALDLYSHGHVA